MDSTHPITVLNKLNEQRSQGLFCDVTIVVEDVKFRAHKNILAACSGYFRSALTTSDTWSSCQVLELMDLKSEVFASILNFIYSSKVTSASAEDRGGLVAAGKRLGIPFLESLGEEVRRDVRVKSSDLYTASVCKKTNKEVKPEETDTARGPRITNAFSITEVCPGNNPFTPLVQTHKERESPDMGQLPTSCPTMSCLNGGNEMSHTLSEHSYAVIKSIESNDSSQGDNRNVYKPTSSQSKQFIFRNTGPLKKRNRLRGILSKTILPMPAEIQTDQPNIENCAPKDNVTQAFGRIMTPPPLSLEAEQDSRTEDTSTINENSTTELSPPHLSPHPEDYISIYSCEQCPEIFSNKALFTIHTELHKKRFVSHLFCKFCQKKFIHLKRLRNHEQICPKALSHPLNPDDGSISGEEVDQFSDDKSDIMSMDTQLPPEDRSGPCTPELVHLNQPEPTEVKAMKPVSSQRRYNCSMCKRVYVTLSSLKRHENVHSWQRAYPCHYCNKVFALAEYRTKHEIWHTGERRYQCIFCLETFMTYYILKNHQKSFHGIDPSLAVKKKSANGGLKASVYPIKLYRLLPMKFRKRQYKTYSHTYSDKVTRGDPSSLTSNSLIPSFDDTALINHPDTTSFPLTFMATTKLVSPVTPRICINNMANMDPTVNSELEICGSKGKEAENPHVATNCEDNFSSDGGSDCPAGWEKDRSMVVNSEQRSQNLPFLNSLNTVKKLGELSASAKRVEDMTKEILLTTTDNFVHSKTTEAKTETYIAKPACQGSSMDSDAMPLCQITVKIGNEAIIRRQIKGSKLFPRKKKKIRELGEDHSSSHCSSTMINPESPRLRLRHEAVASKQLEKCDIECDQADELWRPYYSYKAKKKKKKLRDKHRMALFHQYTNFSEGEAPLDRSSFLTQESNSLGSTGFKQSLSRNCSPRATFNCDICDSSFITETGLKAHIIGSHPYFCRTCGKQGPPGEAPNGGDYVCNSCMESGSCFSDTPRSPNPEKKYRCSFCPQRFLYLATKKSHEKKHQETNEEGDKYDNFSTSSKYFPHLSEDNTPETFKAEESSNQEAAYIKQESTDEEHFSTSRSIHKFEDTAESLSQTSNEEILYSDTESSISPTTDTKLLSTSSKVKQKTAKKRVNLQHTLHLISKKQTCDVESESKKTDLIEPRTNHSEQGKSEKLCRKKMSEPNGTHNFIHKPETWVCKEEPFF